MKHFRQQHRPKKSNLVTGIEALNAALDAGRQVDRIFYQNKGFDAGHGVLKKLAEAHNIPINYVPVEKLNRYNIEIKDGFVGVLSLVHYVPLQDVIDQTNEKGAAPLFLLLDGVTDVRNIGGIARTAYSMGVQALIIPDKGVGQLNEDAILTSAGALEKLAVCRVPSLMKAVDSLRLNGIQVLASEMTATKKLYELNLKDPVAIVMGGEERGIHPALMRICDEGFQIPMPGGFESLNVSVATGMILYEAAKQRMAAH